MEFDIILGGNYFKKGDSIIMSRGITENIYNTNWIFSNTINCILKKLGFNVGFEVEVLSEPKPEGEYYKYLVKMKYKVYYWLNFILYRKEIKYDK